MHDAKVMSRLIAAIVWGAAICFPVGVLIASLGHVEFGLALVLVSGALMIFAIVLAVLALVRVRCSECGGRYFSAIYPIWPFENACARCGASAVR